MSRYGFDYAYDTHGLIHGVGDDCNYTLYTDSVTGDEYKILFVSCDQLYVLDEPVIVLGESATIGV